MEKMLTDHHVHAEALRNAREYYANGTIWIIAPRFTIAFFEMSRQLIDRRMI